MRVTATSPSRQRRLNPLLQPDVVSGSTVAHATGI